MLRTYLAFALCVGAATPALGYLNQPPLDRDGVRDSTCRECHQHDVGKADAGRLTVEGLPARYTPGGVYRLVVRLTHPDLIRGGFEVSMRDSQGRQAGAMSVDAGSTALVTADPASGVQYVHHGKRGGPGEGGTASWAFIWTAPPSGVGPVTVRAAGNASNADDSPLGDVIVFFTAMVNN